MSLLGQLARLDRDRARAHLDVALLQIDVVHKDFERRSKKRDGTLLTDTEPADQLRIPFRVLALQVVEKPAALADELEKPAARVVVLCVNLEMLGQVTDAFTEERDLHLGRAGIAVVGLVRADDPGLTIFAQHCGFLHVRSRPDAMSETRPPDRRTYC